MKVTIVLDDALGEGLATLERPIWVCHSALNRSAAERIWSTKTEAPDALTVFNRGSHESDDQTLAELLPSIDEHHPRWTAITVIGGSLTAEVRACFRCYEPGQFLESGGGFTFVRSVVG